MKTRWFLLGLLVVLALAACDGSNPTETALTAQHANESGPGFLAGNGAWGNVQLVGRVWVQDAQPTATEPPVISADLTALGNYAYLARWLGQNPICGDAERRGQRLPDGGVYVIDISNPASPKEVGFIPTHQDTLVGEGTQALRIDTPKFVGDILAVNHEGCGKNFKGGFSLWNITNPLKPVKLSEHFGDFTIGGVHNTPHDANQLHSVFVWDAGDKAYLVSTDDNEPGSNDVDIYDITNPKKPVLIAEPGLNVYNVSQPDLGLGDSFLHDMVVKKIGSKFYMLLSYWDGGYVILDVTNPGSPVYLSDSDYASVDPELLSQTGISLTPEGNGHQAEFTSDNRYVIATDEDFSPFRLQVNSSKGDFDAKPGSNTDIEVFETLSGTPVFVGRACIGDPAIPPAGTANIAVVERGLCTFEEKAQNVLAAGGYSVLLIMNREGSDACKSIFEPSLTAPIPTAMIARDAGLALFDKPFNLATCLDTDIQLAPIALGAIGGAITGFSDQFDGWGYVHLFGTAISGSSIALTNLDTFAVPEAMNPAFASGYGDLSVHEVATDPTNPDLAYLSYYHAGLRVLQIQNNALVEVGGYIDPLSSSNANGNYFWGIEVWTHPSTGKEYVLASDMKGGIFIFSYTNN